MKKKIPFMLLSLDKSIKASKRFSNISKKFESPKLKESIKQARLNVSANEYLNATILNAILYALIFGLLFVLTFSIQTGINSDSIIRGSLTGLLMGIVFLVILLNSPRILASRIGEIIDSELLYALNDILIQIKGKVEMYKAFVSIVEGNYGYISDELLDVVNDIESGKSMTSALKSLAVRTKSEFLKRVAWQLINSSKSGSDPEMVIRSLINELESYYHSLISNYTKELNVMILIYLTLAVVAPTIGVTILIILSSFGSLSIKPDSILLVTGLLIITQPVIIGFINSRRPLIKL